MARCGSIFDPLYIYQNITLIAQIQCVTSTQGYPPDGMYKVPLT